LFSQVYFLVQTTEKTIGELKSYGVNYTTEELLARLSKNQIQIVVFVLFFILKDKISISG